MSPAANSGGSRTDALLADAARYLEDTAPQHGGRNARPLAVPVLVTSYCSAARSALGAVAAGLGAVAGLGLWFGVGQLEESATAPAVGAFVVAALALAGALLLGRRVLRGGGTLLAALRRWYAVAPEVPVRGAEVLTQGPGLVRLIVAALGGLGGVAALLLAVTTGTTAGWVGYGIAAVSLLLGGILAVLGWWKVRTLLRGAAPQPGQEAFAPAAPLGGPVPQQAQAWAPAWAQQGGAEQGRGQQAAVQPGVGQQAPVHPHVPMQPTSASPVPPSPAPLGQHPMSPAQPDGAPSSPWWPPPPGVAASPDAHAPAPAAPLEGWEAPPSVPEPDLGDTRYAADTTISGRSRRNVVVLLDDGRRLEVGAVTLVGRAPQPRPDERVETLAVQHQTVSKTHAAFRVSSDSVHVTDRSSTNGTTVVDSTGYSRKLRPWSEEPVEIGSEVLLGSYLVRVRAAD